MALWGKTQDGQYNHIGYSAGFRGVIERILNVFGDIEIEEDRRDKGISIVDNENKFNPFVHMASTGMGRYKKYVNYEEASKGTKLRIYRQMAEYPEIRYALDVLTNEIVNKDDKTKDIIKLEIVNDDIVTNINMRTNLRNEWEYVVHELMQFNKEGHETIKNFLVTGEIFFEKVINPDKPKEGLKRVRRLLADTSYISYNEHGEVDHFQIGNLAAGKKFIVPKEEIAYTRFGEMSYNQDTGERIALSYLERVKKVWRQLQLLEEAVIIYRIVRAPERRIWKIATGNMPKNQALQYVDQLRQEYRQRRVYNTSTGEIDGQANILNMLDDFWFSQPEGGAGTDVTTLPGGENLGEIRDLDYFLKKLYLALHIPENRRLESPMGANTYNIGDVGEINHQEVMFAKMADRIADRVSDLVYDIFKTHLKLKGLWKEYELKDRDFRVEFYRNNFFEELKKTKLEESRLNLWSTIASFTGEIISKEVAVKKYLHWTDEEYRDNEYLLAKEKKESVSDQGGGIGGLGF